MEVGKPCGLYRSMQEDKDDMINRDYKQVVQNCSFKRRWETRGAGWSTKEVGVWCFVIGADRVVAFLQHVRISNLQIAVCTEGELNDLLQVQVRFVWNHLLLKTRASKTQQRSHVSPFASHSKAAKHNRIRMTFGKSFWTRHGEIGEHPRNLTESFPIAYSRMISSVYGIDFYKLMVGNLTVQQQQAV